MNDFNDRSRKGGESKRSYATNKSERTSSRKSSTRKESATKTTDNRKKKKDSLKKEVEKKKTLKVESIWDTSNPTKETKTKIQRNASVDKKKKENKGKTRLSSVSDKSRKTSKSPPKRPSTDPKNASKNKQKGSSRNTSIEDHAKEKKKKSLKKGNIKERNRSITPANEKKTYSTKSQKNEEAGKLKNHIGHHHKQPLNEKKKSNNKIYPVHHNFKGTEHDRGNVTDGKGTERNDEWEQYDKTRENNKQYVNNDFNKHQTNSFSEVFHEGNTNESNMESSFKQLANERVSSKFTGLNSQYLGKEENPKVKLQRSSAEICEKETMKAEKRKNTKHGYTPDHDIVNNDANANMTEDEEFFNKKKSIIYRFKQQQLKSWQHYWTPLCLIITYFIISLIFIIIGIAFIICSFSRKECKVSYEDKDSSSIILEINESTCTGPSRPFQRDTYVYYELHSFFQNHKSYLTSKSHSQLMGSIYTTEQDVFLCKPRISNNDGKILHPCGLIAYSIFNDTFALYKDKDLKELIEIDDSKEAITWLNDYNKYKNPSETEMEKNKSKVDFWLLNDHYKEILNMNDKTGYGVENSHFVVWMKTASLANFRKKYGKVNATDQLQLPIYVNIKNNFPVQNFRGKKLFVIAESSLFINEKNKSVGIIYLILGSISLFVTISLLINQWKRPRILGQI